MWGLGGSLPRVSQKGPGQAERPQRAHLRLDIAYVKGSLAQPWVRGHVGFRNQVARLVEMQPVPLVAIAAAVPMQVGSGALGAPLERAVIHALGGERIMAVTLDLVAQRPDHLRMAVVATFADIDVAPGQLQRGIRLQSCDRLGGGSLKEQRDDFHQPADADDQEAR